MKKVYTISILALIAIALPQVVYAQFTQTLSNIVFVIMGIAVLIAVIMIAAGGFTYMGSDVVTQKTQAKEMILSALIGLAIIFGSYIILNTINPNLLNLNLDTGGLPTSESPTPLPNTGPTTPSGPSTEIPAGTTEGLVASGEERKKCPNGSTRRAVGCTESGEYKPRPFTFLPFICSHEHVVYEVTCK